MYIYLVLSFDFQYNVKLDYFVSHNIITCNYYILSVSSSIVFTISAKCLDKKQLLLALYINSLSFSRNVFKHAFICVFQRIMELKQIMTYCAIFKCENITIVTAIRIKRGNLDGLKEILMLYKRFRSYNLFNQTYKTYQQCIFYMFKYIKRSQSFIFNFKIFC